MESNDQTMVGPSLKHVKRNRDQFENNEQQIAFVKPTLKSESDSSSDDDTLETPSTSSASRDFCTKWLKTFPWLIFNGSMFCKWCLKFHNKGKFIKGSKRFKIDGLRNHASSKKHINSIKTMKNNSSLLTLFQKSFLLAQKEFERYFRLIHFIAKENLAIVKYPQLIRLMKDMGFNFPSNTYQTPYAFKEMLLTMSDQCFKILIERVKNSPYFSILVDESTDIETNKSFIIYIRYYDQKTFRVETVFFRLFDIEYGDSDHIYNITKDLLKHYGLLVEYMIAWGSDGASVMIGKKQGIAKKFHDVNPFLLINHCAPHKLNLALKDAQDVEILNNYDKSLKLIYRTLGKSHKKLQCVKKWAVIKGLKYHKLLKVFDIRWLIKADCIKNVRLDYPFLLSALKELKSSPEIKDKAEKAKIQELWDYWSSYEAVSLTYILSDILLQLKLVFKLLQKNDCLAFEMKQQLDEFKKITTLQYLTTDGIKGAFYTELLHIAEDSNKFLKQNSIKRDIQIERKVIRTIKNFAKKLISNINKRFPHDSIMENFKIFDLHSIIKLKEEDLLKYGALQLLKLEDYFGCTKTSALGKYCKLAIDFEAIKEQYTRFKFLVHGNFQPKQGEKLQDIYEIWESLFRFYSEECKETLNLAKIFLTIPLNSTECERGFSHKNLIKTKIRNRLKTSTIEHLMRVAMNKEIEWYSILEVFVHKKQSK